MKYRVGRNFFGMDSCSRQNVSDLHKLQKKEGLKRENNYYAFRSPIGVHVIFMPSFFVKQATKLMGGKDAFRVALKKMLYCYFFEGESSVPWEELIALIEYNITVPRSWSVIKDNEEYKLISRELIPLVDNPEIDSLQLGISILSEHYYSFLREFCSVFVKASIDNPNKATDMLNNQIPYEDLMYFLLRTYMGELNEDYIIDSVKKFYGKTGKVPYVLGGPPKVTAEKIEIMRSTEL